MADLNTPQALLGMSFSVFQAYGFFVIESSTYNSDFHGGSAHMNEYISVGV